MITADRALDRGRAIAALYIRSRVEGGLAFSHGDSRKKWAALVARLGRFVASEPAIFSPKEKKLLAGALGGFSERARIDAEWRLEALSVFAWALSFTRALGPWDRAATPDLVGAFDAPSWFEPALPLPLLTSRAKLRSATDLEHARDLAELWHWRANTAARPMTAPLRRIVADAAEAARTAGDLRRVIDEDFPFRGRAYAKLGPDALATATSIARERQYALEWLTDAKPTHASWDKVRTDT